MLCNSCLLAQLLVCIFNAATPCRNHAPPASNFPTRGTPPHPLQDCPFSVETKHAGQEPSPAAQPCCTHCNKESPHGCCTRVQPCGCRCPLLDSSAFQRGLSAAGRIQRSSPVAAVRLHLRQSHQQPVVAAMCLFCGCFGACLNVENEQGHVYFTETKHMYTQGCAEACVWHEACVLK